MSTAEVLYIGCGPAPDIDPDAERVVLVEPSPDHVPVIRGQVREMGSRVRLIPAAVAAETGSAPFHICNFSDLSGLDVPAALFDLMPGLKQVKTAEVQTLSVADLLKQARIRTDGYVLRCEAPGVVPQLLHQLLADGGLDRVATLWLTVGAEPFHGPGSDADSVIEMLQDHGYRLLAREDEADPDWPCLKFEQDKGLLELSRARDAANAAAAEAQRTLETERAEMLSRLKESDAARQVAETKAAEMQAQLEAGAAETKALQDRVATLDAEVNSARTEGQARIEAMQADLANVQDRAKALGAQRDNLRTQSETLLRERDAARQNGQAQLETAQAELAEAQKQVETLSGARDRLRAELEKTKTERDTLRDRLGTVNQERDAARTAAETVRTNTRAQIAAAQAETAELQKRVETLREKADRLQAEAETTAAKTQADLKAANEARATAEEQLAEIRKARAEVQAQLTKTGTEIAELQERVAALIRDRDTQRVAAETARTDLGMALRMQAMAAADLKDLQNRHTALSATKDKQDAVLGQLALQLGDVSEHLQQIEATPANPRLERDATAKKDGA